MQFAVCLEFGVGTGEQDGQRLGFLPLAFPRVVSGGSVTLDALDATLLLLVVGLCAFARWKGSLGLWQFLTPGLPLLGGLALDDDGWWGFL